MSRVDMTTGKVTRHDFGDGRFCGEPVFAPAPGKTQDPATGREPGWLLTVVYDSAREKSHLAILDAEHLEDVPVATAQLEHHLPLNLHGHWHARA